MDLKKKKPYYWWNLSEHLSFIELRENSVILFSYMRLYKLAFPCQNRARLDSLQTKLYPAKRKEQTFDAIQTMQSFLYGYCNLRAIVLMIIWLFPQLGCWVSFSSASVYCRQLVNFTIAKSSIPHQKDKLREFCIRFICLLSSTSHTIQLLIVAWSMLLKCEANKIFYLKTKN